MKKKLVGLISLIALIAAYLVFRFPLFELHGMKDFPMYLLVAGVIVIVISGFIRENKVLPILTVVGYIVGFIVANTMIGGSGNEQNMTDMDKIRSAVAAKIETSDNRTAYADSEIAVLKSFVGLQIHEAPMGPADNEDDWIYRITFNPAEKVSGAEEIVVSFHDTYVQINSEFYLPDDGVEYSSIMEWVQSKADYMFE